MTRRLHREDDMPYHDGQDSSNYQIRNMRDRQTAWVSPWSMLKLSNGSRDLYILDGGNFYISHRAEGLMKITRNAQAFIVDVTEVRDYAWGYTDLMHTDPNISTLLVEHVIGTPRAALEVGKILLLILAALLVSCWAAAAVSFLVPDLLK